MGTNKDEKKEKKDDDDNKDEKKDNKKDDDEVRTEVEKEDKEDKKNKKSKKKEDSEEQQDLERCGCHLRAAHGCEELSGGGGLSCNLYKPNHCGEDGGEVKRRETEALPAHCSRGISFLMGSESRF